MAATRAAGAARASAPADLAGVAALVLVRPALDRLPGPTQAAADRAALEHPLARAHPDRAADAAAEHPLARRADAGIPAGRARRAADTRADLAGQRRTVVTPHTPLRPLWLCRACAAPWPCGSARVTLVREYAHDRVALLIYLGGLLRDAAGQLHTLNPHDSPDPVQLFDRFLGWALIRH